MAPTKNDPTKVVLKRGRKPKADKPVIPPLKTPTCIKVKIENIGSKPPKIERKVTKPRKIELANEVALEQLAKSSSKLPKKFTLSSSTNLKPACTPDVEKKPPPTRKRKLPVESSSDVASVNSPVKKDAMSSEPTPKLKKKQTVKHAQSNQVTTPKLKSVNNTVSDDSELESWEVIGKRPGPKSKTMNLTLAKTVKSVTPQIVSSNVQKKTVKMTPIAKIDPAKSHQQKVSLTDSVYPDETPKTVKKVTKKKQTPKKPEAETKVPKKVLETPKKPRTRNKLPNKRQNVSAIKKPKGKEKDKDIKLAASALENVLLDSTPNMRTRSNSIISCRSNASWTRDISTSSMTSETTTCVTVCSTDFVRYDKKLPFVQVENTDMTRLKMIEQGVNQKLLEESTSSSSSSKSSDSSDSEPEASITKPELNLSTSSLTTISLKSNEKLNNTELLSLEMDKISTSLKTICAEMDKWLVFAEHDSDTFSTFLENNNMDLEKELVNNCEKLVNTLKKSSPKHPEVQNHETEPKSNPVHHSPDAQRQGEDTDEEDDKDNPSVTREKFPIYAPISALQSKNNSPHKSLDSVETFTSDNYNYVSFEDRACDDEDALSLFAESITGMESSRLSSASNMSTQEPYIAKPKRFQDPHEAYIPQPTRPLLDRYTYRPTIIQNNLQKTEDIPLKTIEPNMVEKQNADSSSILKGSDLSKVVTNPMMNQSSLGNDSSIKITEGQITQPRRMLLDYQVMNPVRSSLYKGYCFFNLAGNCRNSACRFPHVDIDEVNVNLIKCRLEKVSEDNFIQEYLLTSTYRILRQKFGLLFVKECLRRAMTRLLLEMAIDMGLGAIEREDGSLKVNTLEITLHHLNTVSFDACKDLLQDENGGIMLCDALLLCMANSQNFAQFKKAFVKLADFMSQLKRPIDLNIVSNILERVCILPCEESLAKGMLSLMKNTDARIFENKKANAFEVLLSGLDNDVHEEYLLVKQAAETRLKMEANGAMSPGVGKPETRHPSPDTTYLDSLKKAQMEQPTIFKRTIGNTDSIHHLFKSPSKPAPKPRYSVPRYSKVQQWRRGVINRNMRRPPLKSQAFRLYRPPTECTKVINKIEDRVTEQA